MGDYMQKKGLDEGLGIGGNSPKYLSLWVYCISFLHVYGLKRLNLHKKEIQNSQSDKYFVPFQL